MSSTLGLSSREEFLTFQPINQSVALRVLVACFTEAAANHQNSYAVSAQGSDLATPSNNANGNCFEDGRSRLVTKINKALNASTQMFLTRGSDSAAMA